MEALKQVCLALLGIGITVMIGLLKDEASAWLPRVISSVLRLAVARAPTEFREQYAEEWAAHVSEYPGRLSQLLQAGRCLHAAGKLKPWTHKRFLAYSATIILISQNLAFFYILPNFFAEGAPFLISPIFDFAANFSLLFLTSRLYLKDIMKYLKSQRIFTDYRQ